jgi:hypothetical protein
VLIFLFSLGFLVRDLNTVEGWMGWDDGGREADLRRWWCLLVGFK